MALEKLAAGIKRRFGHRALRRAAGLARSRATLPTGLPAVDALPGGGLLGVAAAFPTSSVSAAIDRRAAALPAGAAI